MNEGFLSDSGSDQTQESADQERENLDDGVNEESELNAGSSNRINYFA